tara:strand:+ start:49 stop:369 length:321 start_codon:yes stop_codon:yes gene_type:complete
MMKIIFLITSIMTSAEVFAKDGDVARIYDEWLAQPQKQREERAAEEKRSREKVVLRRIISNGNIISSGEGPDGRSHTFLVEYNELLYTCYFEILGAGTCKEVKPSL